MDPSLSTVECQSVNIKEEMTIVLNLRDSDGKDIAANDDALVGLKLQVVTPCCSQAFPRIIHSNESGRFVIRAKYQPTIPGKYEIIAWSNGITFSGTPTYVLVTAGNFDPSSCHESIKLYGDNRVALHSSMLSGWHSVCGVDRHSFGTVDIRVRIDELKSPFMMILMNNSDNPLLDHHYHEESAFG